MYARTYCLTAIVSAAHNRCGRDTAGIRFVTRAATGNAGRAHATDR